MKIKLLSPNAKVPLNNGINAGYDLYAAESTVIKSGARALIKTDIAMSIPNGYFGEIKSRSGLAAKHGIAILTGTIDAGFLGNISVLAFNTSDIDFNVSIGDRIAQIVFLKHESPIFEQVDDLGQSERGDNGFGSSGIK